MSDSENSASPADWSGFVERLYRQSEFAIELGLEAVGEALECEGRPDQTHRIILVAGTNGKGETAAFLSSILQAHGLRVGLYTSPHIIDLRERFRIDGELMAREDVLRLGRAVIERYGDATGARPRLTFFELTTMMAVLGFAEKGVDVGVYEVGLGGRLDATNALDAQASVVTAIGLDHREYLGETLAEIATEKAGIFRADRPATIGRQGHAEALATLRELAPEGATFYGDDFFAEEGGRLVLSEPNESLRWRSGLAPTRLWNAACAAQSAAQFLGDQFDPDRALQGLEASRWPGRLDARRLVAPGESEPHPYLFDAAHNPDAAQQLFDYVEREQIAVGAVVCAAMKDKDLEGTFERIPADVPVFGVELDAPRAADAERLEAALYAKSLVDVGSAERMLARARQTADASDTILVFGSIYLLGACFEALGIEADTLVTHEG